MSRETIEIPTTWSTMSEARPALDEAFDGLFPAGLLESRWEGDTLHLSGPGAKATVTLEGGKLVGQADLKPPASFMREMIEEKVVGALRRAATPGTDV
jgi:hypothetical protein